MVQVPLARKRKAAAVAVVVPKNAVRRGEKRRHPSKRTVSPKMAVQMAMAMARPNEVGVAVGRAGVGAAGRTVPPPTVVVANRLRRHRERTVQMAKATGTIRRRAHGAGGGYEAQT